MLNWKDGLEFRSKYFRVFMLSIYLGIGACFFTLLLVLGTYWGEIEFVDQAKWFCALSLLFAVCQVFASLMISQGRSEWAKALFGMFAVFFMIDLFTIFYAPNMTLYICALVSSVLVLGCLKSRRYGCMLAWLQDRREMRSRLN